MDKLEIALYILSAICLFLAFVWYHMQKEIDRLEDDIEYQVKRIYELSTDLVVKKVELFELRKANDPLSTGQLREIWIAHVKDSGKKIPFVEWYLQYHNPILGKEVANG